MEIVKIQTGNRTQIEAFHNLVKVAYRNDLNYVMPIIDDVEAVFDPHKNKRFKKGNAERWLLYIDNECVGRIAAFFENKNGKILGGWGYFEVLNNVAYAKLLVDTAETWLKEHFCCGNLILKHSAKTMPSGFS